MWGHLRLVTDDEQKLTTIKPMPVVNMTYRDTYERKPRLYKAFKRLFDVVASSCALIVLSPLFLIVAIAILIEDGGPVFFKQEREGRGGKVFRMYKFRSMVQDAEHQRENLLEQNNADGPVFKLHNDPRVTRVGRFIRKTSIDELPQLINIIKGDMSIVGPRPQPLYEVEKCNEYQRQRLIVRPGLTCYWQVNGRSKIGWKERVELDLKYIEDMSVWTDLKMILKTFPAIISGEGSY